jgi:imidazole glycerol-phosphate synthase subunit HisH
VSPRLVVLDYGSGNVRSVVRALQRAGGSVELTADRDAALAADGLVVPGVGAFAACMAGLRDVDAPRLVDTRLAGGRAVLGICVGMQVMFDAGVEHGVRTTGLGQWPGTVERLPVTRVPHMGWNTVEPPNGSRIFDGLADERFYFVHSYAAMSLDLVAGHDSRTLPQLSWTEHDGARFIAAVENGPLSATQFHPEKSGDAGARLLANWVATL